MNKLIFPLLGLVLLFQACKEQPVGIELIEHEMEDTTYVTTPASPNTKMYLLEELTGVRCVNCPEGAEALKELNTMHNNEFVIVAHHFGSLTSPISGKSIQDFRTPMGSQIMDLIFGGQSNKPSVSFDRLPLSVGFNPFFVDGLSNWPAAVQQMKDQVNTSPINLEMSSSEIKENEYNIHTKVSFTEDVDFPVNLHIYFAENNIWDGFVGSDTLIRYDHVFRTSLTGAQGKPILRAFETIEAGRVYELNTKFKKNQQDEKEQYWNLDEMQVILFVTRQGDQHKNVLQVMEAPLK